MEMSRTVAGRASVGEIVQLGQLGIKVLILSVNSVMTRVSLEVDDLHLGLGLVGGVAGGGRGGVLQEGREGGQEGRRRGSRDRGAPLYVSIELDLVLHTSTGLQVSLDRQRLGLLLAFLLLQVQVILLGPVELYSEVVEPGSKDPSQVCGEDRNQTPPDGGVGED